MKRILILLAIFFAGNELSAQLIINEVLYDPSDSGLLGDANGDGVYNQEMDSFIEFVNIGSTNFDASGYEIWDDITSGTLRYTIPAGTFVPPMGALVVFGSGPLVGSFGGAVVLSADDTPSNLNFNNTGEVIGIKNPQGEWELTFDSDALSNNPNESYTRTPDITGDEAFVQHGSLLADVLFSPGTMFDGTPFNTAFVVESIDVTSELGITEIAENQGTLQMFASILPLFATDQSVSWSVEAITGAATIDQNGLLTAAADGDITVVATANDASGITGSMNIVVSGQSSVLVTSIVVDGEGGVTTITEQGGGLQMIAIVLPLEAENTTVTWSLVNGTGSGTIDTNGFLEALTDGVVTVVATANDGSGVSGSLNVTISNQGDNVGTIINPFTVSIYPNPAAEFINIVSSARVLSYEIVAIDGKVLQGSSAVVQTKIDLSMFNAGVYFLRIQTERGDKVTRFIKH
ncbi:MAG: T9SS type A sorting domain-containing protein [Cryomorphaceae bacterium]|nr:T9SS type A sorting domain-containing protein [Cryomorphaceae bacterium]